MSRYIRAAVPGATYFFTVNLHERGARHLTNHVGKLRASFAWTRDRHPFSIDAIVVMPDHLHALWTLPPGDGDFSTRWMLIKQRFSRGFEARRRRPNGEVALWQRRYWEHLVRDEHDFARHVDYIHFNPVKHGFVERAADWRYSSIHQYIARGLLPAGWGMATSEGGGFGE